MDALFEELEKDIKAANLTQEGEHHDEEDASERDSGYQPDLESARGRVAGRRAARNSGTSSQNKVETPQKDDGASRGRSGESHGDGGGTQGDDGASQESGSPSQGSEKLLEDDKKLSPKEEAYNRRINRENETKIKDLETQLAALSKPAEVKTETVKASEPAKSETLEDWLKNNPKPDREKDLAGYLVWNAERQEVKEEQESKASIQTQEQTKLTNLVSSAKQEIESIESNYKKANPDYDNAINFAKEQYSKSVKLLMPHLNDAQISQLIDKERLAVALKCTREGTNIGEVLYDMAIERFGYEPGGRPNIAANKPNLRVVSNNKRKSASSLEGGGQSGRARVSLEAAADMSPQELMSLDSSDLEYLESQGF